MQEVTVEMHEGMRVFATGKHTTWVFDEPESAGGTNEGPTPMQSMVGALGACTAITLRMYSQRKGWPLEGVRVRVVMTPPARNDPHGPHAFRQEVLLRGPLDDAQRERLHQIACRCPVHRVLETPTAFEDVLVDEEGEVLA